MSEDCSCEEDHGHSERCCRAGPHWHRRFIRRFITKMEKIEKLERYAQDLKNELVAVQEHIKELKGK